MVVRELSKILRKFFSQGISIRLIAPFILILCWIGPAVAQGTGGWGQAFVAPGASVGNGSVATFQTGFEGGLIFNRGLGLHAGLGYLTPLENFDAGIGLFSPGVSYTFRRAENTQPFVTGGYTLFFRSGTASGLHFGAGFNHWFSERIGLRLEGRDQVLVEYNDHFVEARIGFLFR